MAEDVFRKYLSLLLLFTATTVLRAQVPVAAFTANQDSGCAPLQVTFFNTSSGAVSYQWSFGNGNNSTLHNPSSSYANPGNYTVILIATSATGLKDTAVMNITILGNPISDFNVVSNSGCEDNNNISFLNLSSGANSYIWDFGDGSSSTATNPTHTYTNAGTYNVKLIAINNFGCQTIAIKSNYITIFPKPQAQISISQNSACDVNTIFQFTGTSSGASAWNWNFGDGNSSNLQNPSHQYGSAGSFPVTLIVTSANGCTDTTTANNNITIGSSLVPSFTMDDSAGCGPLTIQFDCTVPNATTWSWNFGDGTTSTIDNPIHTYTTPGSYAITLSVTTQSGCNGSVTLPNLVTVDAIPVSNFTVVQDSGCVPFNAQFINLSSGANSYSWHYGNGDSSILTNPTTVFTQGGYFSVTLTAYSPNGCQHSITKTQYVRVFAPTAAFSGTPLIGCPGMTVQFTHTGNALNIISYQWNFGDGTFGNTANPSHTYNAIGNYTVWLVVTNSFGCKDTVYKSNYVKVVSGQTAYTVPDTLLVCQDNPIAFTDPTTGSNTWNWNFGNGTGSTTQAPSVIYQQTGLYTVTLNTSMPGGCSQTFNPYAFVKVIPYDPRPIDVSYNNPCKPYVISFSTLTPDITAYLWDFGDGTTSTLANPTHTFQNVGTYSIVLNVTIGEGCLSTITTSITVGHANPIQASAQDICLGAPVQFNLTDSLAFNTTQWHFGDGNISMVHQPAYTYTTSGNYNVQLITTDTSGCIDTFSLALPIVVNNPIPAFSAPVISCLNSPVTFLNTSQNSTAYFWDFGDGSTSTDTTPTHAYTQTGTYTIALTATKNSCSVTQLFTAYLNVIQPVSQFNFTTSGQCMPVTVNFINQSPSSVAWKWYFGNGDSSQQQHPVYTYLTDPTDSIYLIITDANGCSDTSAQAPFPYYAAGAVIDDSTGCNPHTANFTDSSNGAIAWHWEFGDGTSSTLQNPSHTYNSNGSFTITLIAEFPGGCHDTIVYPNMLNVSTPIADFFSPTMAGCSPTQISFVNTTSDATIFNWDFGDGGSSTNIHPQHIYYIPGTYTITLISSNSFGCSDTMIKPAYISIPGTYTQFNISTLSGCQGQNIVFTDSSVNASNWNWDFGDGAIDSVQHPIHVYGDTGSYTVTLITRDSIGCTSSYVYPAPIIIHPTPVADASVTDPAGCSSFNTTFINLSSGATDYIWNFGDGDTSQSTAPGHTYLTGGQFFPDLIAITSFGCKDTFTFNTAIDVWQTPAAQISANDTVGCQPATITFNSTSTLTQNPSYFWLADNGTTSTSSVFQPVFINDSIYTISLVITNANGCPDTANLQVTIHPTPVAGGSASSNTGCNPLVVQFTNSSTGGSIYNWLFGNGDSASTADPIYNYTTAGIFNPAIIASNNFGCADTLQLNPGITVLQSPTPAFSSSSQQACYGDNIQLIDQSTNLISPAYLWNFGFGTSTLANPLINCTVPGIYDVSLLITNGNGCSDSIRQALYLEIFDTIAPVPDPIASASVVDDNTVIITWLNSAETDVASYRLYRQNSIAGTWDLIYTDTNPVLSTVSLTSSYTDTGLSAKTTSYSYKLQTTDQCGYTTALDSLTAHSTINLTATRNGVSIDLNWTPYLGCNFNEYRLYRTERPNGNAVMIASIPGTEIQYTDSTLTCPFEYEYRIEAIDLCGRGYNAWSDTSAAWPENIFENQHSEIIRTTVVNNKDVMTEWLPPVVQPNRVLEYQIFRSSDNINYSQVTTIPAGITTWTDTDVDINNNSYSYKVIVVNDCNISSIESNKGKSILLTGHWKDHRTYLQWSPYEEWSMGVEQYTIEFLSPQGVWVPINSVDGSTTSTQIDD